MEIDLREIQALHARYAREPVVIDLEAQVRARPAPLLLAHGPAGTTSSLRRIWATQASVGRGALMVIGSAAACAAIGMGTAKLYEALERTPAPHTQTLRPVADAPAPPATDTLPAATQTHALTAQDFGAPASRGAGLASVDYAALMRQEIPATPQGGERTTRVADEQLAAAPPKPQQTSQSITDANAPVQTDAPAAAAQPARLIHHVAPRRAAPARDAQRAPAKAKPADAKPAAATAHGGDVQLF